MTRAYIEAYLKDAMRNIGAMSHFCINKYGVSPEAFSALFFKSRLAEQLSKGNPRYLVGLSGKELADLLISTSKEYCLRKSNSDLYHVTPEYWAGWVMAYYQWYTAKSFAQMYAEGLTYQKVLNMYHPLHEADLSKVVEVLG